MARCFAGGDGIEGLDPAGNELRLELGNGLVDLLAFLERPAVPAVLAFDRRDAFALDRPGKNHRRVVLGGARGGKRVEQRLDVMAVDDHRVPAEGVPPRGNFVHPVFELGVAALAERVHVDDAAEVVELVIEGDIRRFPHRAFSHLTVAEEHVRPVVGSDPARVERRADGRADTLAERARRDVDKRQARRGVTLEVRVDAPQVEEVGARKEPGMRPGRVENRRRMTLRQDEAVVVGILRRFRIEAHLPEKERRDDLCRRHARRRVAASGFRGRQDRIDAKLGREVLQRGNGCSHFAQESLSQVGTRGSRLVAAKPGD